MVAPLAMMAIIVFLLDEICSDDIGREPMGIGFQSPVLCDFGSVGENRPRHKI